MSQHPGAIKSEERLIPTIRAAVAEKLAAQGFQVKGIAMVLNVTPAAVTQYVKRKRGASLQSVGDIDHLIDPIAEKAARMIRTGSGSMSIVELLETARQVMVMSAGRKMVSVEHGGSERNESLELLRERLQLELSAAEKYLELANKTSDDQTKLLLRMISSDSIRHADVVSQVISWLEAGKDKGYALPGEDLLRSMLALEDSAKEANLQESVKIDHPVARLLLEWIDMDEAKHGRVITRMLGVAKQRGSRGGR
jgi:predicted transcriptional regulator/bacterioferritin (cytochrome b1)